MLTINRSFHIASFTHKVKQTYTKEAAYCLNVDLLLRYDKSMNIFSFGTLFCTTTLLVCDGKCTHTKKYIYIIANWGGDKSRDNLQSSSFNVSFHISLETFHLLFSRSGGGCSVVTAVAHVIRGQRAFLSARRRAVRLAGETMRIRLLSQAPATLELVNMFPILPFK